MCHPTKKNAKLIIQKENVTIMGCELFTHFEDKITKECKIDDLRLLFVTVICLTTLFGIVISVLALFLSIAEKETTSSVKQ